MPCVLNSSDYGLAKMNTENQATYIGYYGTSGTGDNDGIYTQTFSLAPLELNEAKLESRQDKAGFLRLNRNESLLYSIALGSGHKGLVRSFRIDKETSELEFINEQEAAGGGLCHINLDRSEKWLMGASYDDAVVTVFPVNANGLIGKRVCAITLEGEGTRVNPERQEKAHSHSVYADPSNRFVFVCDLGMDRIYVYHFDTATGALSPATPPFVETALGAGPRHLAFHGNGRWIYAINELNGSVTQYDWDQKKGELAPKASVDTLPEDFSSLNTTAEILVHPSNRFLYGSNRGHDSIVVYSIDESDGSLELIQRLSSGGAHPRNFTMDEEGRLLVVANRDSNNIVYFEIDRNSGVLSELETVENIPACTCVRVVKR